MKIIEQTNLGEFNYVRYELQAEGKLGKTFGVVRPTGEQLKPLATLYLFHAATGDDTQPVRDGFFASLDTETIELIRQKRLQIILPHIGVSFLQDTPLPGGINFSHFFYDELMPEAERDMSAPEKRLIAGVSAGGFAALSAFFKAPERFAGVGVLAPAIFDLDFFDARAVQAYCERTGAQDGYVAHIAGAFKAVFRDYADFVNASPNRLAHDVPYASLRGKILYLNVGDQDEFGLLEGVRDLSRTLFSRDVAHQSVIVPSGKHDMVYANSQFQPMIRRLLEALN